MRQIGYTRVSTAGQDAQLQLDALLDAGVQKRDVFADVTSGSKTAIERPGMTKLLEYAETGDTVIAWRIDRLGRSLIDVLNTVELLRSRGIHVRSLSDGIDPATSTSRLWCAEPTDPLPTFVNRGGTVRVDREELGRWLHRHMGRWPALYPPPALKQRGVYRGRARSRIEGQVAELCNRAGVGVPKAVLLSGYGISVETRYAYLRAGAPPTDA